MFIEYLDRSTRKICREEVYGGTLLEWAYGKNWIAFILGQFLLKGIIRYPWSSKLYGWIQKLRWSKYKIDPFVKRFEVDLNEFEVPKGGFASFNDFFCRRLKPGVRTIAPENDVAILPADGRYLCIQNVEKEYSFLIKGNRFNLQQFLLDDALANEYAGGSAVLGRLCPSDYHRFHFPFHCRPANSECINGFLYSVNPFALKRFPRILTENRRVITRLQSAAFGQVLFCEIGATNVGSIQQTYIPRLNYKKGDEKGYFEFGGSAVLILFKPGTIQLDEDLLESSKRGIEVLGQMGQSLGKKISPS